jgi:nitrate/nitrite transport system substrate-binding protein
MSTFDPFLPLTSPGCACGAHRSQAEHNHYMQLQLAVVEREEKRSNGVVTAALLRTMFPRD